MPVQDLNVYPLVAGQKSLKLQAEEYIIP